jgi:hypothetical protein
MTLVELPVTVDFTRPYAVISTWLLLEPSGSHSLVSARHARLSRYSAER